MTPELPEMNLTRPKMSRFDLNVIFDRFRHDRRILIGSGSRFPESPSGSAAALVCRGFRGFSGWSPACHPSPSPTSFPRRFSRSRFLRTWSGNTRLYRRISEKETDLKYSRRGPAALPQPAVMLAQLLSLREKASQTCFYFEIPQYLLDV